MTGCVKAVDAAEPELQATIDARRVLADYGEAYGKYTVCGNCEATCEGHVDEPHCGGWGVHVIGDPFGEHVVVESRRRRVDARDAESMRSRSP